MTRINVGIPPRELSGKHLIAEHRELKRIPNAVGKGKCRLDRIPARFSLGTGHVSFFYDKLGYLLNRYRDLYNECCRRGYSVQNYESAWKDVPPSLMNNYEPTDDDIALIKDRIAERLANPIAKQKPKLK
jgi:deoxyribonuclease (pyrimidine dimer)